MSFRNYAIAAALLAVMPVMSGCDTVYGLIQKEGLEEKKLLGDVDPTAYNEKVAEIQKLLKVYGYPIGPADGKMGANTRNAIERFQGDYHLKATRFVDHATWEKLSAFERCGLVVNGEVDLEAVQRALIKAGYRIGKPDGVLGPRTRQMLQAFQKAHGLHPDGVIGIKTLRRLAKYLET